MRAETRLPVLRAAFLLVLAAIAFFARGVPSAVTLLVLAGLLLVVVAARMLAGRLRRLPRELQPAVGVAAAIALAAAGAWLLQARGPLSMPWVTLLGIPLAIALVLPGEPLVPRSRPLAGLFFVTLALGLVATEPWSVPIGRLLLATLALLGIVASVLDVGRSVVPPGLPAAPAPARRRAAATAVLLALLALLSSLGVDAALSPLPRMWDEAPKEEPREDRLAAHARFQEGGSDRSAEQAIALVRVVDSDLDADEIPQRLYLRTRVLDDPVDDDALLYFGPRVGTLTIHRDADDGSEDQRIHWSECRDGEAFKSLVFQVTLLADTLDTLLVVPVPRWIEGSSLSIAPDGAVARPTAVAGSFTYRTAGLPRAAFDPPSRREDVAAHDPERTTLPPAFDGRDALEAIVAGLISGQEDDLAKARALATHLRRTGRIDARAPFRGWSGFAATRAGMPLHFAQCFVALARLARMPARVVVGFCSDEYDEKDRRFEVRGKDLHYWGEVKLEEIGWVDFDPCPELTAIDPSASAAQEPLPPERTDAKSVRSAIASERPLVVGLLLLLLVAAYFAFPSLRLHLQKSAANRPPAGVAGPARRAWRFWQQLLDCCRRFGLEAHPASTAEEFARTVGALVPAEWNGIVRLLRVYHACRFGGADLPPVEEEASRELLARLPLALQTWRDHARAPAPRTR